MTKEADKACTAMRRPGSYLCRRHLRYGHILSIPVISVLGKHAQHTFIGQNEDHVPQMFLANRGFRDITGSLQMSALQAVSWAALHTWPAGHL